MNIDRILSLTVVGGFLDGVRVEFAPQLNCIIGARGTGKTTILELIRYTLDQLPRKDISPAARKRVEQLVDGNLQGGRVELEVETRDGLRYFITRSVREDPIVLDAQRNPTALTLDSNSFFRADIFSQNEVETIADHGEFQLELIDSFAKEQIDEMNRAADEIAHQLVAHAKRITPLIARMGALNEDLKQLPVIDERLKGLTAKGDQTAEQINNAHAMKALRDRETRAIASASAFLAEYPAEIDVVATRFRTEMNGKFTPEMMQGPNGAPLTAIRAKLLTCFRAVEAAVATAKEAVERCLNEITAEDEALKVAHREQELTFRSLIERHKEHQNKSAERAQLERRRNTLMESKAEAASIKEQLGTAEKKRTGLLTTLSETRDKRFGIRKQVAERLNATLSPNITVSVSQDGNLATYQELIESSLKGSGVKQGLVAQKIIRTLPPAQLAELVRAADAVPLMERGDLNVEQANKLIAAFNSPEKLAELETVSLDDSPTIKLRVGDQNKDSGTLSTGQKCTTVLPILLLEGGNPLLIDQPEDNLDNRFIFETVVDNIHKVKSSRQLIFVTHNPNIPVLGDASQVIVMESGGERARPISTGSVDECKADIVTLLEGGAEAFRRRGQRYSV
ncbi:MAG: AAA family ATPase [Verrucomicrobiales bacterium]|nr:AAA family ATPase [Verrucomicrobiales bacterium]